MELREALGAAAVEAAAAAAVDATVEAISARNDRRGGKPFPPRSGSLPDSAARRPLTVRWCLKDEDAGVLSQARMARFALFNGAVCGRGGGTMEEAMLTGDEQRRWNFGQSAQLLNLSPIKAKIAGSPVARWLAAVHRDSC